MGKHSPIQKTILACVLATLLTGVGYYCLKPYKSKAAFESQVFSTAAKSAGFALQKAWLELSPHSSVKVNLKKGILHFSEMLGHFEFNILPNTRIRINSGSKGFDLASVNGGRIQVEVSNNGLQVQNAAGDILVIGSGNESIRLAKSAFVSVAYGRLEIAALAMPKLTSPTENQRFFTSQPNEEVLLAFKSKRYSTVQTEYVISDVTKAITYQGLIRGNSLRLSLAPGHYYISARSVRGHEYSAWTEPRAFTVWTRSTQLATSF